MFLNNPVQHSILHFFSFLFPFRGRGSIQKSKQPQWYDVLISCFYIISRIYYFRIMLSAFRFILTFEMILLGESISAVEAERIGLINKVVPEAELDKAESTRPSSLVMESTAKAKEVEAVASRSASELSSSSDSSVDHQFETDQWAKTWDSWGYP